MWTRRMRSTMRVSMFGADEASDGDDVRYWWHWSDDYYGEGMRHETDHDDDELMMTTMMMISTREMKLREETWV